MRPIAKMQDNEPPVVLYVSDDTGFINTVRRNLGQAGFSVVTTRSAADALELIIESEFDAVISDYDLLQTDALTLLNQIQNLLGEKTPPTLIVTEQETSALKTRCIAAGAASHHAKSESVELLIERVTSALKSEAKRTQVAKYASRRFKGGTDPLTQVATKEHFGRRLKGESMAAYRDQTYLSILVISLDQFKKTLDRFGKQRADSALAQTARLIEGDLRSRDCVARYAEHTFAVTLPGTKIQAAAAVGRRLKRRLSTTEFGDLEQPISLTVSIGVSCRPPGMQMAPDDLISQAARSSAAAQKMGGDRVLADDALTGSPLVLVLGDPSGETGAVARSLEECNVELRLATSAEEARDILSQVPVAMVMAEGGMAGGQDGVDFLTWIRDQFPAIRRVLISDSVSTALVVKAVNRAAIHYIIMVPGSLKELPKLVDELLFS